MSTKKENKKSRKISAKKKTVKVSKDGPYMVFGNTPLLKTVIEADEEGYP
jgi:hypothetical protein